MSKKQVAPTVYEVPPASPSEVADAQQAVDLPIGPAGNTRRTKLRVLHSPPPPQIVASTSTAPQIAASTSASASDLNALVPPPLPLHTEQRREPPHAASSHASSASRRRALEARAAHNKALLESQRLKRQQERLRSLRRLEEEEARIDEEVAAAEQATLDARLQQDLAELTDEEELGGVEPEQPLARVDEWLDRSAGADGRPLQEKERCLQAVASKPEVSPRTDTSTAELTKTIVKAVKMASSTKAAAEPRVSSTDCLLGRLASKEMTPFSGDPADWLRFKNSYEVSTTWAGYTPAENVMRLQNCLRGEAKEAVAAQMVVAASPDSIMRTLELRFGQPKLIVMKLLAEVRACPKLTGGRSDLITLATRVANCVAAIQATKQPGYLHSPELCGTIVGKLTKSLRSRSEP